MSDWLDEVSAERAAVDSAYAVVSLRADLVLRLVPVRKALGLTQEDVAKRMGVARPRVVAIESRPHKVSLDRIAAYAAALGARVDVVLPEGVFVA
jgi:transcriptional regulator with XRE-family HTH domain